ncbi:unnamed protein product [Protopolystoma xenopodis]|uniref:Uncharacterized protein n=1 Tax=Protopolystoma xenopodis TaxID=117903 RepID=A0A448XCP4_9PLAT|nr:unnamed protein product [Protopolystoma xenopodis]
MANYGQSDPFCLSQRELETDRLNTLIETDLILQLEAHLLEVAVPSSGLASACPRLLGRLVRNHPQGPVRQVPAIWLNELSKRTDRLCLARRLCSTRQPDFLLQLVRAQSKS